mmetsp:Transcript_43123/g.119275  ORF Transcript_43123/g.119275 Transcript_43123/m.119275 type:complete len:240 (-) Transcript_43123:23-742(-)
MFTQSKNHGSLLKACTLLQTSSMTHSSDASSPMMVMICSAPRPGSVASLITILAPDCSRNAFTAAPCLPMIPPTAARGITVLNLSSPGAPISSPGLASAHSATLAMTWLDTSLIASSVSAATMSTRQSVSGKISSCSENLIVAWVRCRIPLMTAPPFPMTAETMACGANNFTTHGMSICLPDARLGGRPSWELPSNSLCGLFIAGPRWPQSPFNLGKARAAGAGNRIGGVEKRPGAKMA